MPARTLPSPTQPTPLLEHLIATLRDSKRTRVKEWLRSGLVHLDGVSVTSHAAIVTSQSTIEIRDQVAIPPRSLPLDVLFEDASIIVVDKPNGLLTVGNRAEKERTVQSIVDRSLAGRRQRTYIVQRLDLYTSGVLVLAKSEADQTRLKRSWGSAEKIYHAWVEGIPTPRRGTLTHHLIEDERLVVHACDTPQRRGVIATLEYEVVTAANPHSLVRIDLKTGKKNQIRAQFSAIGHPIAGDAKYGGTTDPIGRLCLHASSLTLTHPKTGQRMTFQAPVPFALSDLAMGSPHAASRTSPMSSK